MKRCPVLGGDVLCYWEDDVVYPARKTCCMIAGRLRDMTNAVGVALPEQQVVSAVEIITAQGEIDGLLEAMNNVDIEVMPFRQFGTVLENATRAVFADHLPHIHALVKKNLQSKIDAICARYPSIRFNLEPK